MKNKELDLKSTISKICRLSDSFLEKRFYNYRFNYNHLSYLNEKKYQLLFSQLDKRKLLPDINYIEINELYSAVYNPNNFCFGLLLPLEFKDIKGSILIRCDKINTFFYRLTAPLIISSDLDLINSCYINNEFINNLSVSYSNASRLDISMEELLQEIIRIDSRLDLDFSIVLDFRFMKESLILDYFLNTCNELSSYLPNSFHKYYKDWNYLKPQFNFFSLNEKLKKSDKRNEKEGGSEKKETGLFGKEIIKDELPNKIQDKLQDKLQDEIITKPKENLLTNNPECISESNSDSNFKEPSNKILFFIDNEINLNSTSRKLDYTKETSLTSLPFSKDYNDSDRKLRLNISIFKPDFKFELSTGKINSISLDNLKPNLISSINNKIPDLSSKYLKIIIKSGYVESYCLDLLYLENNVENLDKLTNNYGFLSHQNNINLFEYKLNVKQINRTKLSLGLYKKDFLPPFKNKLENKKENKQENKLENKEETLEIISSRIEDHINYFKTSLLELVSFTHHSQITLLNLK